jgi:hypothetical protein
VIEKWRSFHISEWGGFKLKEKLNLFKVCLKEWHRVLGRNIEGRIKEMKDRMNVLNLKWVDDSLNDEVKEEIRFLYPLKCCLYPNCIVITNGKNRGGCHDVVARYGNANSGFFHGVMSNRKCGNTIHNLVVEGA